MNSLLAIGSLAHRELKRFYRQPSRIIGSLGTPLIFWVLLGSGLKSAFPSASSAGGRDFFQYFFPGNLCLAVLFTSIFYNISLIEDRNEGFLQSVLVAPVSRLSIVLGKVLGGAVITLFQGMLFLLLAPVANLPLSVEGVATAALAIFALGFALTALGFLFAWWLDSIQGFHSVMNLVLIPMWILSGAFFPLTGAPAILKPIMWANPVTYGIACLQESLGGNVSIARFAPNFLVTVLFALLFVSVALAVVRLSARKVTT